MNQKHSVADGCYQCKADIYIENGEATVVLIDFTKPFTLESGESIPLKRKDCNIIKWEDKNGQNVI